MRRAYFLVPIFGVGLACAPAAHSEDLNFLLRGTYSLSGSQTCIYSIPGFSPVLTPLGENWFENSSTLATHIFNGDGTGSDQSNEVSIDQAPFQSASSSTFSFNFTYTVNPDLTVTTVHGAASGSVLTGPRAHQTFTTNDDSASFVGRLSPDGRTLTLVTPAPAIETVTFSNGDVRPRICTRSRVLIKIDNDTDHDGPGQP